MGVLTTSERSSRLCSSQRGGEGAQWLRGGETMAAIPGNEGGYLSRYQEDYFADPKSPKYNNTREEFHTLLM